MRPTGKYLPIHLHFSTYSKIKPHFPETQGMPPPKPGWLPSDHYEIIRVCTSCIPTSLDIRSMSIIFTSNRSLQFSSCFSSFSAKSKRSNKRFAVDLKSTKQNSSGIRLKKAVSLLSPSALAQKKFKVARALLPIGYFSSHMPRRSKAVRRFSRKEN